MHQRIHFYNNLFEDVFFCFFFFCKKILSYFQAWVMILSWSLIKRYRSYAAYPAQNGVVYDDQGLSQPDMEAQPPVPPQRSTSISSWVKRKPSTVRFGGTMERKIPRMQARQVKIMLYDSRVRTRMYISLISK